MALPNASEARHHLRRSRILRAINLPEERDDLREARDALIEPLVFAASTPNINFGRLSADEVDLLVSLAITRVEEEPWDAVAVMVMCVECLAADGQFARLNHIGVDLREVVDSLPDVRPALVDAFRAFARLIQGRQGEALTISLSAINAARATRVEGVDDERPLPVDLLCLVAMRAAADGVNGAMGSVVEALALARRSGDALVAALLAALQKYVAAIEAAATLVVLRESDDDFLSEQLTSYVMGRGVPTLFPAQIEAVRAGVTKKRKTVVALPTSSGKTLLAEFRTAATLHRRPHSTVIYVAPYRLLASQVEASFRAGLGRIGVNVVDLGGRFDTTDVQREASLGYGLSANVVVVTPERLDALMRARAGSGASGDDARALFASCSLVIFDELHLLGRPGRGPRFEMILTRLLMLLPDVEFLGLSAASHAADELSRWITDGPAISGPRRPTGSIETAWAPDGELRQRVEGGAVRLGHLSRSKTALDDAARLMLQLTVDSEPVLAITVTRPIAESLALRIVAGLSPSDQWWERLSPPLRDRLNDVVSEVEHDLGENHPLVACLRVGVAFHHAGVPAPLLRSVERLASDRALRIMCATTTVAEGSDLPLKSVVIPHVNFPGPSRRLERDLYLNVVGRAGRAHVSVEGLVFLLESESSELRNLVQESLWRDDLPQPVESALPLVPSRVRAPADRTEYLYDMQSQVLAWLGDGASYVDKQAEVLARATFAARSSDVNAAVVARQVIDACLNDLDRRGYAKAASPYRLTEMGQQARLTGLSAPSVDRLRAYLTETPFRWEAVQDAVGMWLDETTAKSIARLLFQSLEVLQQSLWFRRQAGGQLEQAALLQAIGAGRRAWPNENDLHADVALVSDWISGASYVALGQLPPRQGPARSLFGVGGDEAKLASDACEYVGRLLYPAGMTWSAVAVLENRDGVVASHVRNAIEYGLPSESSLHFLQRGTVTRRSALSVAMACGHRLSEALSVLQSSPLSELVRLPKSDHSKLDNLLRSPGA